MLPDPITSLIRQEQARQNGRFIELVDLEAYLAKLDAKAEIVSDCVAGRCRGVVAFYCNDLETRQAFITLLVVDPADRGLGIGQALVGFVLSTARQRGFASCRLEVSKANGGARAFYQRLGFVVAGERAESFFMETRL